MAQSGAGQLPQGLLLGGRYRLDRPLGSGAMGVVFAATDERMGRDVAVKVVRAAHMRDAEALERFEREARHAGRLGHANIVAVTDMGRTDEGHPFVVMERLDGRTLEERIEEGPLPLVEAIQVHVQLLDALACAHDAGVLHRDVKPANTFLSRLATGAALVKLLDFGIATTSSDRKLTMDGAVVGSPIYLAPERFRGQPARIESDLYSVGVSLYESLTGQVPFDGKMGAALVERVLNEVAPRLDQVRRDVPSALADVVARALAKAPEARFANARQMREALLAIDTSKMPQPADARRPGGTLLGIADPSAPIRGGATEEDARGTLPQGSAVPVAPPVASPAPRVDPPRPVASAARLGASTELVPRTPAPAPRRGLSTGAWIAVGAVVVLAFVGMGALAAVLEGPSPTPTPASPAPAPPVPAVRPAAPAPVPTAPPPPAPSPAAPPVALPVGVDPPPEAPAPVRPHPTPTEHPRAHATHEEAPAPPAPAPAEPPPEPAPRGRVGPDGLLVPNW